MSTIDRPEPKTLPPLVAGQHLDQPTFHERYEAMPPGTRAELIDGVVFMPRAVGLDHGRAQNAVLLWMTYYVESTPGIEILLGVTTILGRKSEPQPDALLRILPECGGQTRDEQYVVGAPELVVEVSHATRYVDLGPKLADYQRAGVIEYIVRAIEPDEIIWHCRNRNGRLVQVAPDADGLFRSRTFPGLWLDPAALIARDPRRLRDVLDLGCATPEHQAFGARLAAALGD
jgi:Uma2 family endonuclease